MLILGGFLADKVLGNRMAVMLGALLMAIGHVVLGASAFSSVDPSICLVIIVCGYGLFKSKRKLSARRAAAQRPDPRSVMAVSR